jgi:hypothetical protein
MANTHEIHTKDDVPLWEIAENTENLVNYFNEADRPFRDLFVDEVSQQTFLEQIWTDDERFEKLSEGEFPNSVGETYDDNYQLTINTSEYGQALGMTQRFIERSTSDHVMNKVEQVIENAKETEEQDIYDVVQSGISDGSEDLWFDVPDHGNYQFGRDHSHVFPDSQALFGDTSAHEPHEHIERAAEEMRHHGWNGRQVCLCSLDFKRKLRDELSWDAQYHIPMANGMRSTELRDQTVVIDGVELVQSPYLQGDEFYNIMVNDGPIKWYQDRPLQLTQPTGGPTEPGEILNATATMSYGLAMVNPLGAVHFKGDSSNFA